MPQDNTRTAALAAEWAAEIAPGIRGLDRSESHYQGFFRELGDRDAGDTLRQVLCVVIDESRSDELAAPLAPSALGHGTFFEIGRSLKWVIRQTQIVAAPYPVQRRAIPEQFVCLADEVALDFGWVTGWVGGDSLLRAMVTDRQLSALFRVREWLGSFSGGHNAVLWTEEAIQTDPHWTRARQLAAEALELFGVDVPSFVPNV